MNICCFGYTLCLPDDL